MKVRRGSGAALGERLRSDAAFTASEKAGIVLALSAPAIIARLASIMMQYIDAAMVGSLGADASAAIGLVASTTWLFGGIVYAAVYGFSVQIAHAAGAGDKKESAGVYFQGGFSMLIFSLALAAAGLLLSLVLPEFLGAGEAIRESARVYFAVCAAFLPVSAIQYYAAASLQAVGSMKAAGSLEALMCALDVIFNLFFIFPSGVHGIGPLSLWLPGLGLGVAGAAAGTGAAELVTAVLMLAAAHRQPYLSYSENEAPERFIYRFKPQKAVLRRAVRISLPSALQEAALSGAMVLSTRIVAPLGSVAIAANSFAVTAESICYMPGYGIGNAATTLVGQSIGAGKRSLARSFAFITVGIGMLVMLGTGILMYFICPGVFAFLTPDGDIAALGVQVLRIELWAEPFFGASIIASGALRGAEDTLVPGIMTLASIWGVRITLSFLLVGPMGLSGVWTAMCVELIFRGIIFLFRLVRFKFD